MKNLLFGSIFLSVVSSSAILFGGCNSSSTTSSTDTTKMMKDTSKMGSSMTNQNSMHQDSQSVVALITANYDEVKILQLALTKTIAAGLKANVNKMLTDHKGSIQQLNDLASKQNIGVPTATDSTGVNEYNTLSKETGNNFEKDFLSWLVQTHNDAIAKCQDITKTSHDNDLVTWCNNTLPTLQEHLQMAKTAQGNLKQS